MSITTIVGPMFSGKTTELIRRIDRHRISGKRCVIIKHIIDTRFDGEGEQPPNRYKVVTHSEVCYAKCDVIQAGALGEDLARALLERYDVIGIDEGFFFRATIVPFSTRLANAGAHVVISTINTSYQQKLWPEIGELMGCSENVIQLSAICMRCKETDGYFTIRISESNNEILVGGVDDYAAVCRDCLNTFNSEKPVEVPLPLSASGFVGQ